MRKKSSHNFILGIIIIGFILSALYFSGSLNTILRLGGQWSQVNVTLSNDTIMTGDSISLNMKFNPAKLMIKECPSDYRAFAVVSIYIDNKFYKIINLNDIRCNKNTSLKISLPKDLSIGEHNITAKIGVMRFLETGPSTTYRLLVNNSMVQGSVDRYRERYFFEDQLTNQKELYMEIINKIAIPKVCPDVKARLKHCYCGGRIGPLNSEGCLSYACYSRHHGCTGDINGWSWERTICNFNQIKSYMLGQEHTDFDYFDYVKMDNMVETTEKLIILDNASQSIPENLTCQQIYFTCWDNSKIIQYSCVDNINVKTNNVCPTSPEGELVIYENDSLKESDNLIPTEIQNNSNTFYYIIGGVLLSLLGIILFIKFKK